MKAIITGSGSLIGSECVRLLSEQGWEVVGVDNDMRRRFPVAKSEHPGPCVSCDA